MVSYLDFATADTHDGLTLAVLPGVLRATDLPELMARIAPVPVRLVRPRQASGGHAAFTGTGNPSARLGGDRAGERLSRTLSAAWSSEGETEVRG